MNIRDEVNALAGVIAGSLDGIFGARDFGPATQDYKLAEDLIAAGYTKPRTITTIEELDALANGTVVMDGQGEVARKLVYGWRVLVSESGFDAWLSDPLEETYLPATVLYEPTA